MKRCDICILNQFDKDEFKCQGDLKAPECIGMLQGAIETLSDGKHIPTSMPRVGDLKISYAVSGEGVVYIPRYADDIEIAQAILDDCSADISIEFVE